MSLPATHLIPLHTSSGMWLRPKNNVHRVLLWKEVVYFYLKKKKRRFGNDIQVAHDRYESAPEFRAVDTQRSYLDYEWHIHGYITDITRAVLERRWAKKNLRITVCRYWCGRRPLNMEKFLRVLVTRRWSLIVARVPRGVEPLLMQVQLLLWCIPLSPQHDNLVEA